MCGSSSEEFSEFSLSEFVVVVAELCRSEIEDTSGDNSGDRSGDEAMLETGFGLSKIGELEIIGEIAELGSREQCCSCWNET